MLGTIAYFVAGCLIANGIPHFVKGVVGERHMSPFGRSSHPVVNVLWGSFNFLLGYLVLLFAQSQGVDSFTSAVAFALGAVLTAAGLAKFWSNPQAKLSLPRGIGAGKKKRTDARGKGR